GTTMPSDPGQYTASITVNAGGTGYTLTKTYNVYSYAQINNIYPQLNISTDKYASTTAAGANETVTITFTPKFGETLTSLTVTGATTNYSIGSGITDNGSNTYTFTMPAENVTIGATYDVTLSGRTLYKDGAWNTLCLPFDVTLEGSPLEGAVAKTLDLTNTVMSGTNVHIAFGEPVEVLTAGVPYIIKWESGNSIANPTFEDVAITAPTAQVLTSTDECTRFIGYYDAFDIDASDTDIFYMTADNTLKYTAKPRTLKAFRAYFQFSANGGSDVKALTFDMDFGDGDATGIELVESGELRDEYEIYDLAGRRVSTPTKGLYIINGKKVFIK
ncbi:MAG: hypothetical protein K5778_07525, partial [Bacteroidaceae bacterium]|nr:hypothetical protein [Bacteroidaceae bacterium]